MTLKELEKRLKKEPDNLGLKVQVAGLMREAGRSTEAVELYRSVALVYRDQGRTQQSIAVCKAILEIAPDDERCIALLSMLNGRSTPSIPSISAGPLRAPSPSQPPASRVSRPSQPPASLSRPPSPTHPPPAPSRPTHTTQPPPAPSRPAQTSQPPPVAAQPAKTPSQPPGQPPKTSSRPPVVVIPPKPGGATIPPRMVPPKGGPMRATSEATPAPAPSRAPTAPVPPSPMTSRLPLEPPTRRSSTPPPPGGEPKRRSSMEETPLPRPVPHHIHDPTGRNASIDPEELDTSPNAEPGRAKRDTGLAVAARKIAGKMKGPEPRSEEDISRPLDTRPVRRVTQDELQKLAEPPPTVEHERVSDESITQPGEDEELTSPQSRLDPED